MSREGKFHYEGAHPSWYPRVLRTLERDYPKISDEVWKTAVTENARENVARREAEEAAAEADQADAE